MSVCYFHHADSLASHQPLHLLMAETIRRMVINHPGRLHVRINDGRPDEVEAALFEVSGNFIGQWGFRRYLGALLPGVLYGFAVDEVPDVIIERAEFLPDLDKCPGVSDCRTDLEFVPDDGRVFPDLSCARQATLAFCTGFFNTVIQLPSTKSQM